MHVYLIRHGETDWNDRLLFQGHTDVSLNKNGIRQAEYIADELKNVNFDVVFSSDLKRALKTAQIIKKTTGFKGNIIKTKDLRERNYGSFEGKNYEIFRYNRKDFDGETDRNFFKRIDNFFNSIIKRHAGKNVVIVTHGGVVRRIISEVLGLKDYKKIRIYNASISEIYYDEKRKKILLLNLNCMAHFPKKERIKIRKNITGV
ncbi:MAG: histidine phosphatase family protein [Candidatus Goldbacteria bacterium]|nr:histidine phosphatase family protein [Candidatus Goldiibacteriota bacterium]